MPGSGAKRARVEFQTQTTDARGRPLGVWETQFERRAEVIYVRGGEGVMQGRLQGKTPAILTVQDDADTRTLTTAWRAKLTDWPRHEFNIRGIAPAKTPRQIDLTCEAGGV